MPGCPHCSEPIESLEGFIPQAKHELRLKAKTDENKALGDAVSRLTEQTKGHDAIIAERDRFRSDYEALQRSSAMSEVGLSSEFREYAEMFYESAKASGDDASFSDWLGSSAQEHPLLRDKFQAPGIAPVIAAAPAAAAIPSMTAGAAPASGPGGKISPNDVQSYFQSAEYARLSSADKRSKIAELQQQTTATTRVA